MKVNSFLMDIKKLEAQKLNFLLMIKKSL